MFRRALAVLLAALLLSPVAAEQPALPTSIDSFPVTRGLPDLFAFNDGSRVNDIDDWKRRRAELIAPLLFYQYGSMPPKPDMVAVQIDRIEEHENGLGTKHWLTLIIDSKRKLRMRAVLYQPKGEGPHPVIIEEDGNPGNSRNCWMFLEKNYVFIEYAGSDLDPGRRDEKGPAQKAYPEHDWAMLAAWAWGGMRVVDYLETRDDIDMKRIAITGHSRGGKATLLAAALDERITLAAPNGSGAGGAGSSRILGPGAESIGMNDKPDWYHPRILMFAKNEARMPFDQHFLKALVAPRALICIESTDDLFANPVGTYATSDAAMPAFELYGRQAYNAIRFRRGGHTYNTADWRTLLDFCEWSFYGRQPEDGESFWQRPAPVTPEPGSGGSPGFVAIGDPGNAGDVNYQRVGSFGAVDHSFEIGIHKVSNAEYAAFLNAVAADTDPHQLYHPEMRIRRGGNNDRFNYTAHPATANAAVTYVSWVDAIRYCNWLHGQDTESGAYSLTGERQSGAKYFLPTDDEWYKAAYYDPAAQKYRLEPLRNSHKKPILGAIVPPRPKSRYGMLGAADPIWEWTESKFGEQFRGLRSDSWFQGNNGQAKGFFYSNPELELGHIGFRVARAVE